MAPLSISATRFKYTSFTWVQVRQILLHVWELHICLAVAIWIANQNHKDLLSRSLFWYPPVLEPHPVNNTVITITEINFKTWCIHSGCRPLHKIERITRTSKTEQERYHCQNFYKLNCSIKRTPSTSRVNVRASSNGVAAKGRKINDRRSVRNEPMEIKSWTFDFVILPLRLVDVDVLVIIWVASMCLIGASRWSLHGWALHSAEYYSLMPVSTRSSKQVLNDRSSIFPSWLLSLVLISTCFHRCICISALLVLCHHAHHRCIRMIPHRTTSPKLHLRCQFFLSSTFRFQCSWQLKAPFYATLQHYLANVTFKRVCRLFDRQPHQNLHHRKLVPYNWFIHNDPRLLVRCIIAPEETVPPSDALTPKSFGTQTGSSFLR